MVGEGGAAGKSKDEVDHEEFAALWNSLSNIFGESPEYETAFNECVSVAVSLAVKKQQYTDGLVDVSGIVGQAATAAAAAATAMVGGDGSDGVGGGGGGCQQRDFRCSGFMQQSRCWP